MIADIFEKLFDHLKDDWFPFTVIYQYEAGIRLRLGKYVGTLEPGFHWKIPLADKILSEIITDTVVEFDPQFIMLKNGKTISVKPVVKYRVSNVKPFLLKINDAKNGMADIAQGTVTEVLLEMDEQHINTEDTRKIIFDRLVEGLKEYGIKVLNFKFASVSIVRPILLVHANAFGNGVAPVSSHE